MNIFPININIEEQNGLTRKQKPARLGIPFPCGTIFSINEIQLINEKEEILPFQAEITAHWHDESIRWLLIDFFIDINKNTSKNYRLILNNETTQNLTTISIKDTENEIIVDTGLSQFHINNKEFLPFNTIYQNEKILGLSSNTILRDTQNNQLHSVIDNIILPKNDEKIRSEIFLEGSFQNQNSHKHFLNFKSTLTFYANSEICDIEFTLHNPNRAMHPGGFWDLGDEGSEYFESLLFHLNFDQKTQQKWKQTDDKKWNALNENDHRLYQDSSGGDNWNHHIHIDKDNQATVSFKGYQLSEENSVIKTGLRASPIFQSQNKTLLVQTHIHQFWQNFPKAISTSSESINIELFPKTLKSPYELQGGEQKTHKISLNFSSDYNIQEHISDLKITLPLNHYHQSDAMPYLPEEFKPTQIDKLINEGLEGERNFFWKREKADEYGWRNFGELWADHETLEHGNDESLVSHYNNQYDPILGFDRQYLLSGDSRWLELMNDLARHVTEIDIYHSSFDRPEYNNGLFWHTDHYLDGRHCTHRTFSKTHMEIDHVEQSGGGPGDEHCYTNGLLQHYYLTGSEASKSAVFKLSQWHRFICEGGDTILSGAILFLKRDLPFIKRILKGDKVNYHQYAFTRATGNYINTQLDAYQLNNDDSILQKIENTIANCISPLDDIDLRHLDEPESTWSYIILMQAICKYIYVKSLTKNFDQAFYLAYESFKHYAEWIVEKEVPYLENPERFNYPNDTWTAQDIRKASVMYFAFNLFKESKYQKKVDYYLNFINQRLAPKSVLKSTRILCILLQSDFDPNHTFNLNIPLATKQYTWINPSQVKAHHIIFAFLADSIKRLMKLSITDEINWIKSRLSKNI